MHERDKDRCVYSDMYSSSFSRPRRRRLTARRQRRRTGVAVVPTTSGEGGDGGLAAPSLFNCEGARFRPGADLDAPALACSPREAGARRSAARRIPPWVPVPEPRVAREGGCARPLRVRPGGAGTGTLGLACAGPSRTRYRGLYSQVHNYARDVCPSAPILPATHTGVSHLGAPQRGVSDRGIRPRGVSLDRRS